MIWLEWLDSEKQKEDSMKEEQNKPRDQLLTKLMKKVSIVLFLVQLWILCRYGCMLCYAVCMLLYAAVIMMSSSTVILQAGGCF